MPSTIRDSPKLRKVAKDVFALVRYREDSVYAGFGTNQAFVILDESVLVFDTGFNLQQAKSLDSTISKMTDKKITYVVNSHHHSDHVFGNYYFFKKYSRRGLHLISHRNAAGYIRESGKKQMNFYKKSYGELRRILPPTITSPDISFDSSMRLEIDGTQFAFIHPESGAHTLGDTVLAIPSKGVILMGDVLFNSFFPNLEDANLESWIELLRDIDYKTYTKFVPGHGDVCGKSEVENFRSYLELVRERLLKVTPASDLAVLRACFETESTALWKFRFAIDNSIKSLFP